MSTLLATEHIQPILDKIHSYLHMKYGVVSIGCNIVVANVTHITNELCFITLGAGTTVTTVLHLSLHSRTISSNLTVIIGKIGSRHSSASHLNPKFCKVSFLHS